MWFDSSLTPWKPGYSRSRRPRLARPAVEQVEDRILLASYSAASVSALIADINAANTAGGTNTITLTAATNAPYILTEQVAVMTGLPGIRASDNLTIIGNGDTIERSTAAGTPLFRLFAVNTGGSLTLENLTLEGGSASQEAFSNQSPLTIAMDNDGGAIFDQGALTLSGVTVQDNSAASGGGICSYNGSVTLEGGSIVQNNTAEGLPAGIYTNNPLPSIGGGLYAYGGTVTVTNAALNNNGCPGVPGTPGTIGTVSTAEGGGLYAYECTVNMTSATVNNNSVGLSPYGGGGGIYARGAKVTMTNTTLDDNICSTTGLGGGLCLVPVGINARGSATLTNCAVQGNSAGEGGGLYVLGVPTTLANDTVEYNSSLDYDGGGLYIDAQMVTLTNDTVEFNVTGAGTGGGIFIFSGCTVDLDSFTLAHTINNKYTPGLSASPANIVGLYKLIP